MKRICILLVLLTACSSPQVTPTPDPAEAQRQQQEAEALAKKQQDEERETVKKQVRPILAKLEKQSGYKPQIIKWGDGNVLTVEARSYYRLSDPEEQILENYARTQALRAIMVGDKIDSDTIKMDEAVWGY